MKLRLSQLDGDIPNVLKSPVNLSNVSNESEPFYSDMEGGDASQEEVNSVYFSLLPGMVADEIDIFEENLGDIEITSGDSQLFSVLDEGKYNLARVNNREELSTVLDNLINKLSQVNSIHAANIQNRLVNVKNRMVNELSPKSMMKEKDLRRMVVAIFHGAQTNPRMEHENYQSYFIGSPSSRGESYTVPHVNDNKEMVINEDPRKEYTDSDADRFEQVYSLIDQASGLLESMDHKNTRLFERMRIDLNKAGTNIWRLLYQLKNPGE